MSPLDRFYAKWSEHNVPYRSSGRNLTISQAKSQEGRGYVPLCARIFRAMYVERSGISIYSISFDVSRWDEVILSFLLEYTLSDFQANCRKECPGFSVIPVEPFSLPFSVPIEVKCQRMIPPEMLTEGWEELKRAADHFNSRYWKPAFNTYINYEPD